MNAPETMALSLDQLISDLSGGIKMDFEVKRMDPLFKDEADYQEFLEKNPGAKIYMATTKAPQVYTDVSWASMPAPPPPK